jgi:thiamine transport system permease protein
MPERMPTGDRTYPGGLLLAGSLTGASHWARRAGIWFLPLTFLLLFFFLPLGHIFALSIGAEAFSSANLELISGTLGFTLFQAVLSTVLTLFIGLPAAVLFAYYEFPARSLLHALTAVPFMLPTVVVASAFNAFLGPRGWINLLLMAAFGLDSPPVPFVGTLSAILLAHVFYNTTIVIRLVGASLANLDPRMVQSARVLGADSRHVWSQVRLPLVRPALLAAAFLVFLFDFTSFGVILLLGGPGLATLEVQIYIQAFHLLNLPVAALLALVQLICTLVFSILYSRLAARGRVESAPAPERLNRRVPTLRADRWFVGVMLTLVWLLFLLPMLALPLRSLSRLEPDRGQRGVFRAGVTGEYYTELFVNRQDSLFYVPPIRAAANSLVYACTTVALSLLLGFPAASALAKPGRLEHFLDPLLILPLGASAVGLGLGFIVTFGRWLSSPWMVPLAHTLVALPFVIRTLQPALASLPVRLRQAALSLGASPLRAWIAVDWPIIRRAGASAAGFAFTISLGEFGATSLLSRPEYPTIPIAIYRFLGQPGGLNYGQAMAMATLLMALTTASILFIERVRLPGMAEF